MNKICWILVIFFDQFPLAFGRPFASDKISDWSNSNEFQLPEKENSEEFATEYLIKFGYMENENRQNQKYFHRGIRKLKNDLGISKIQFKDPIKEKETILNLMKFPRCSKTGGRNNLDFQNSKHYKRFRRFVANRKKWIFTDLTWHLSDPYKLFKNRTDFNVVRDVISHAFSMWSLGTNHILRLKDQSTKRSLNTISDIEIFFASGSHGDHEPFDGPGGIVAHSGYPMEGKIHFDASELWTVGGIRGIDFRYVALHEVGHSLGLRHSQSNDSIMYPIYIRDSDDLGLSTDDVTGIQYLYNVPVEKKNIFDSFNGSDVSTVQLQQEISRIQRKLLKNLKGGNGRRKRPKTEHQTIQQQSIED